MFDAVLTRLLTLGLLPADGRASYNVFIRLDNILMNVFDEYGRYYYLRLAEAYDLEREYGIAQSVARTIGRFVPQPLAFFREGPLSCIVLEGIDFKVLTGTDVLRARPSDLIGRELLAYCGHAARTLVDSERRAAFDQLVGDVEARYAGTEQEELWRRVLSVTDQRYLAGLPSQLQHGDFVLNNFGMRIQGLVIFDWEDFGRIDIPGFDISVLLGSLVNFDPERLRALRNASAHASSAGPVRWLNEACRIVGVEPDALLCALPFHLLLFMWLKDRYSPAIRQRVQRAIESLL